MASKAESRSLSRPIALALSGAAVSCIAVQWWRANAPDDVGMSAEAAAAILASDGNVSCSEGDDLPAVSSMGDAESEMCSAASREDCQRKDDDLNSNSDASSERSNPKYDIPRVAPEVVRARAAAMRLSRDPDARPWRDARGKSAAKPVAKEGSEPAAKSETVGEGAVSKEVAKGEPKEAAVEAAVEAATTPPQTAGTASPAEPPLAESSAKEEVTEEVKKPEEDSEKRPKKGGCNEEVFIAEPVKQGLIRTTRYHAKDDEPPVEQQPVRDLPKPKPPSPVRIAPAPTPAASPPAAAATPDAKASKKGRHRLKRTIAQTLPLPPRAANYKFTVVFDLDQTLVNAHSNDALHLRPALRHCLEAVGDLGAERILWTASNEAQARYVLRKLGDLGWMFDHIVTWDTAGWAKKADYFKDLAKLKRPLNTVIMFDNDPVVVRPHIQNAIVVPDFGDSWGRGCNQNDMCLAIVVKLVEDLVEHSVQDVPGFVRSTARWVPSQDSCPSHYYLPPMPGFRPPLHLLEQDSPVIPPTPPMRPAPVAVQRSTTLKEAIVPPSTSRSQSSSLPTNTTLLRQRSNSLKLGGAPFRRSARHIPPARKSE